MDINNYKILIIVFAGMMLFSVIINWILLKFVRTLGIRNTSETMIRWSATSKPSIGGLGFFIAFLILCTFQIINNKNVANIDIQFLGIIIASAMGFLMGLFDDAFNTKPYIKLATQIACGGVLIITGTYIHLLNYDPFNYLLTLFWIIGMMNSINMLDNMDGITTSVSSVIMLTCIAVSISMPTELSSYTILLTGMFATLIGFLFYNWHPSKMFMGDTGSQFLGVFLGAMGIIFFWNHKEIDGSEIISKQFLIGVLAFIVPIVDTTTVSIKRIKRGVSPFVGGKDHTTHHLSYLGLSDGKVAMVMILIGLLASALVLYAMIFLQTWGVVYQIAYSAFALIIFIVLFAIANKNKQKN